MKRKKKCAGYQTGASGKQRCSHYEEDEVKNEMVVAKNKDEGKTGFVDVAGAFGTLAGGSAWDYIAPIWGGVVALGAFILIKKLAGSRENLKRFAGPLAALAGIVGSVPMYWIRAAGGDAARTGAMTGALVGMGLFVYEEVGKSGWLEATGIVSASKQLGAVMASGGARVTPTSSVPANVRPSMDVGAFAARV